MHIKPKVAVNDNICIPHELKYTHNTGSRQHCTLKSQGGGGVIARDLVKTGATLGAHGMIYKAVSHLVLLYGSEIWLVTGEMLKVL